MGNRHWLWAAAGVAFGVAIGRAASTFWVVAVLFVFAAALALCQRRVPWADRFLLLFLAMIAGAAAWAAFGPPVGGDAFFRHVRDNAETRMVLEGRVGETPVYTPGAEYVRFVLSDAVVAGEGAPPGIPPSKCLVRWTKPDARIHDGALVRVDGIASPCLSPVNFKVSGFEGALRNRGVFSQIRCKSSGVSVLDAGGARPGRWISRFRQWQADTLNALLPAGTAPFTLGVWLGERFGMDRDLYRSFMLSGTVHVLSVSGLHVGLVYLSLQFLLRMLRVDRRVRAALVLAAVFGFALAAGARPATMRAALMVAMVVFYELAGREEDILSALGLSAVLLLLHDPAGLFDPGFILSYLAMASLLLFEPPFASGMRRLRLPRPLARGLGATCSAQLLTIPAAAWFFQVVPMAGLAANLVVVPLLAVLLWLVPVILLLAWAPPLASLFGHALGLVVWLAGECVRLGAALPGGHADVPRPAPLAMAAYFTVAALLYAGLRGGLRWRVALPGMAAFAVLALLFWQPRIEPGRVHVLDVGHADAMVVVSPGGGAVLVDGGDLTEFQDAGQSVVVPFLRAHGISRLESVVATHADSDHLGGLMEVVRRMPVGGAYLGKSGEPSPLEKEFCALCAARGVAVVEVAAGDSIPLPGTEMRVLHPPAGALPRLSENDASLVLRVAWPGFSMLLAGDIEEDAEKMLALGDCRADVLKVPHHGSASSSTEAFLNAVNPKIAVFSTRAGRFRAVGKGVWERYEKLNLPLYRTDWHGGITLFSDSSGMVVQCARNHLGYDLAPSSEGFQGRNNHNILR